MLTWTADCPAAEGLYLYEPAAGAEPVLARVLLYPWPAEFPAAAGQLVARRSDLPGHTFAVADPHCRGRWAGPLDPREPTGRPRH